MNRYLPTTAMSTTLSTLGLGKSVSLNESMNLFTGQAYTSGAGNTYFSGLRFSEDIIIKEDVGIGYARTFLNGIKVYAPDATLIAEAYFHCVYYSKEAVRNHAKNILLNALSDSAVRNGYTLVIGDLQNAVNKAINSAIDNPQTQMLERFAQKRLA